ncbi:MAG: antitoxin Xre/MbcA/ParS toxin-binding domain-containing protein [Mongoliitalea sp.]
MSYSSYKYPFPSRLTQREDVSSFEEGQQVQYFFKQDKGYSVVAEPSLVEERFRLSETMVLFDYFQYTQAEIAVLMEVDPSTLVRWKKEDRVLTKLLTKSIKDMDKIVAKGIRIFGSEELFSTWLHTINEALGSQKPVDILLHPRGIDLVDQALDAMSWGSVF